MDRMLPGVALALLTVWRLWTLRRGRITLWRATIDVCIVSLCIAHPMMKYQGPPGGRIGDLGFAIVTGGYALQLVTATSARVYSRAFRRPETTLRDCHDLFLAHGFFTALLIGSWLCSPLREGQTDLGSYAGPQPVSIALYKLACLAWVIVALLDVGFVSLGALRVTSRSVWPGLSIISFAFFANAVKLIIEMSTILPGADPEWYSRAMNAPPPVALILVVGLTTMFVLPRAADRMTQLQQLRTLEPLWRHLSGLHPELVLTMGRSTRPAERLARQAIELRDMLARTPSRLQPGAPLESIARELLNTHGPLSAGSGTCAATLLPPAPHAHADLQQLLDLATTFNRNQSMGAT